MRHPKELNRAPYQVYSGAEKFATSLGMGAYGEAENSSRRTMMKDPGHVKTLRPLTMIGAATASLIVVPFLRQPERCPWD